MGGLVTLKDLGLVDLMEKTENNRLTLENESLRNQIDALQRFISQKWIVDIANVQEYVEEALTTNEFDSVKVIQARVKTHDWVLNELDRFEGEMTEKFNRAMDLYHYGRPLNDEEKAEGIVKCISCGQRL